MPLQPGERLGPYEIQALLGVGGMGEVYRGRDTRLGRDVALKVISPSLVGDPSHRRRFEVEARAASVLNHPSIVTIYDVGDTAGVSWIAMEWVPGRSLRRAIEDGPLPLRDVLSIAGQIADGLAAAHAKGVVHRDLKPENVMLAADGRSKILDFGVARLTLGEALEGPASSKAETVAAPPPPSDATREGTILGTVGYMSPEQAAGRSVDFRSDQFALGLIAYEMLTGQRAFARPTAVETLSAVIRDEPIPVSSIRKGVPEELQGLIARCLAKQPEYRFGATRDLATAFESLGARLYASPSAPPEMVVVAPPDAAPRLMRRRPAVILGAALLLSVAALAWVTFRAPERAIGSLAVLPFENASKDPDAAYFGDGLTESLINQMSRVPSLRVMARATVFRYKGTADPQDVGRKLGVGAVLTGSVTRMGNQLSVSAELMETATGARLWGETYDRPFADLLRLQDSIASGVSKGLRLRFSSEEKRTLERHGTENPEAYELFLKAHLALFGDTREEEALFEARRLFRLAVEKDPRFAEAHLGVATTYGMSAVEGYEPPAEALPRVDEEVRKTLDLDPGNLMARCALVSRRFFFDWDWAGTEREFRELITDPRLLLEQQFRPIGLSFWARGQNEEAIALMERALRVDPGNVVLKNMMGNYLAQAGRLEQAIGYYRAALETEPSDPRPLFGWAEVLHRRGDVKGAIDTRRRAYELAGEEDGAKALATARTEKDYDDAEVGVARSRLVELEALAKERYVSPLDLARLYAQVGEREKAFASLQAALAERSAGLVFLKVERAWDRIRDDARFGVLVKKVGIP